MATVIKLGPDKSAVAAQQNVADVFRAQAHSTVAQWNMLQPCFGGPPPFHPCSRSPLLVFRLAHQILRRIRWDGLRLIIHKTALVRSPLYWGRSSSSHLLSAAPNALDSRAVATGRTAPCLNSSSSFIEWSRGKRRGGCGLSMKQENEKWTAGAILPCAPSSTNP